MRQTLDGAALGVNYRHETMPIGWEMLDAYLADDYEKWKASDPRIRRDEERARRLFPSSNM